MIVESIHEAFVVAYHPERDIRLKLTRSLYNLLRLFHHPRMVATLFPDGPQGDRGVSYIRLLFDKGFLIPVDANSLVVESISVADEKCGRGPCNRDG